MQAWQILLDSKNRWPITWKSNFEDVWVWRNKHSICSNCISRACNWQTAQSYDWQSPRQNNVTLSSHDYAKLLCYFNRCDCEWIKSNAIFSTSRETSIHRLHLTSNAIINRFKSKLADKVTKWCLENIAQWGVFIKNIPTNIPTLENIQVKTANSMHLSSNKMFELWIICFKPLI